MEAMKTSGKSILKAPPEGMQPFIDLALKCASPQDFYKQVLKIKNVERETSAWFEDNYRRDYRAKPTKAQPLYRPVGLDDACANFWQDCTAGKFEADKAEIEKDLTKREQIADTKAPSFTHTYKIEVTELITSHALVRATTTEQALEKADAGDWESIEVQNYRERECEIRDIIPDRQRKD